MRSWTRATLDGHPHSEDAALIVTELGTNALMHTASGDAAGTFHVTLTVSELTVVIAVTDSGDAKNAPRSGIRPSMPPTAEDSAWSPPSPTASRSRATTPAAPSPPNSAPAQASRRRHRVREA